VIEQKSGNKPLSVIGIQATVSTRHQCGVTKIQDIVTALGIAEAEFSIVFVVTNDNLPLFKFPSNLGMAKLFVTSSSPTTKTVMQNFMKKRK
jgi:hypothetical protein